LFFHDFGFISNDWISITIKAKGGGGYCDKLSAMEVIMNHKMKR